MGDGAVRGRGARLALVLALGFAGATLAAAGRVHAAGMVVRVLSEAAEVRTGPSFTFRAVYVANRGETLEAVDRSPRDFWFRVLLPDGTYGWILGDQVLSLAVDPTAAGPPSLGQRIGAAIFSPPPLLDEDVALSFSAGSLGGEGMLLFRPAYLLAPHLALEGFVGETVGEQLDVLYYGLGANLFLWPSSPVTPFFALGLGGARGRPKADEFTYAENDDLDYAVANVGGGLLVALKKRLTLRADYRTYAIFDPNYTRTLQEISLGLAVLF